MSVLPSRFFRLRFLPRDRLCRRPALPALILPVAVMRKRLAALRFVFNFGILRVLPGVLRRSGALYTRRPEASSLRRLRPGDGHAGGLPHRSGRAGAGLPGRWPGLRRSRDRGGVGAGGGPPRPRLEPPRGWGEGHEEKTGLRSRGPLREWGVLSH